MAEETPGLSDEQVGELIRAADAGIKERKRHWYTLGIKIAHRYGLHEQLEAIRSLGKSSNPRALEYLRRLNEFREEIVQPGDAPVDDQYRNYGERTYPNARGELRWALLTITWANSAASRQPGDGDPTACRTLEAAVAELEASLKQRAR
jgi:hypothetical protein